MRKTHEFTIKDFIPYVGKERYNERNMHLQYGNDNGKKPEEVIEYMIKDIILLGYNCAVTPVGVLSIIGIGIAIAKGLELVVGQ